ncbi:hypothetical protein OU556_13805, partial [Escherichia coli]|nr:hypothetical protein [Escherichia coli]MDF8895993.1 hypothetical protein [Escherichia coli]
ARISTSAGNVNLRYNPCLEIRGQEHENDANLDYVFKGHDISRLFKSGEAFNLKRERLYPNKAPIPTRILVIDLELLKNTKQ